MTPCELDAWLAEHLFGMRWHHEVHPGSGAHYLGPVRSREWQPWERLPDGRWLVDVPRYSEHIAWAWGVVLKMRERGWATAIDVEGSAEKPSVGVLMANDVYGPVDALAAYAPAAICRAAYSALTLEAES